MPEPASRPSERKIAALLLIAVVAAAIGLYSYGRENPGAGGIFDSIKEKVSFTGFSLFPQSTAEYNTIDARLSFEAPPEITIRFQNPADEIVLSFSGENKITIDKINAETRDSIVSLRDYKGKIVLGNPVSISGNANSVLLNPASQLSSDDGLSVEGEGMNINSVMILGTNSINIELRNITGTIKEIDDSGTSADYRLKDKMFSLSSFSGDIEFYGNKIVLKGTGRRNADPLKRKG